MTAALLAGAAAVSAAVLVPGREAEAAPAYSSKYTQQMDMADLLLPALFKNTDPVGVALQLETAMRYGSITQGDIWEYMNEGAKIDPEALKLVADDGYISGYLYKQAALMAPDCEDLESILDMSYYVNYNPSVLARVQSGELSLDDQSIAIDFMTVGMPQGLQGNEEFNLEIFKKNYPDLAEAFGSDNGTYYIYYLIYGKEKNLVADHLLSGTDD